MMYLTASIAGTIFDEFMSYSITRNISEGCSTFHLTTRLDLLEEANLAIRSPIELSIGKTKIFTGVVETITCRKEKSGNGETPSKVVTLSGRDNSLYLVNSTLGKELEFKGIITLEAIIATINKILGVSSRKIINRAGIVSYAKDEVLSGAVTDTIYSFLDKIVTKKRCFISSDEDGNLVINRSTDLTKNITLYSHLNDSAGLNNIVEAEFTNDSTDRYGVYRVHGQANPSGTAKNSSYAAVQGNVGIAYDPALPKTLILDVDAQGEHNNVAELEAQAQWEATVRKAKAISYNCKVKGHVVNNELLRNNIIITVDDQDFGLNYSMLVKEITYNKERGSGSTTELVLVLPDSYLPEPLTDSPSKKEEKRKAKRKETYTTSHQEKKKAKGRRNKRGRLSKEARWAKLLKEHLDGDD